MTVAVGSLGSGALLEFDLDSQSGILNVLKAIRLADISPAEKNKIKDLVFLFSKGGDEVLGQTLLSELKEHKVTLDLLNNPPEAISPEIIAEAPASGFSGARPTPVFKKLVELRQEPVKINVSKSAPIPVAAPVLDKSEPRIATTKPVIKTVSVPVRINRIQDINLDPTPAPKIIEPKVIEVAQTTTVTQANNLVASEKIASSQAIVTPIARVMPVSENVPNEPVLSVQSKSDANSQAVTASRMERIRDIKSDVNNRVGNPVNLVDVDNTIGREYMTALLEAMKLLTSASLYDSEKAMSRLETVYAKVINLLDTTTNTTNMVSVEAQASAKPMDIIMPVVPVPVPSVKEMPIEATGLPVVENTFAIRSKVVEKSEPKSVISQWGESETLATNFAVTPVEKITSVADRLDNQALPANERLTTAPANPIMPVAVPVGAKYNPESVQSVFETAAPLREISELPTAAEVSAHESMGANPLYTKDVDAGLDQLLGEWSIFKKSGLFGSGPKGREHPLFVKIAGMQVPLILAGRFEGSNQEIKQSITDYMNGWRYEQGIVYEANETLEMYLRRVIRHIIDLQISKRRS